MFLLDFMVLFLVLHALISMIFPCHISFPVARNSEFLLLDPSFLAGKKSTCSELHPFKSQRTHRAVCLNSSSGCRLILHLWLVNPCWSYPTYQKRLSTVPNPSSPRSKMLLLKLTIISIGTSTIKTASSFTVKKCMVFLVDPVCSLVEFSIFPIVWLYHWQCSPCGNNVEGPVWYTIVIVTHRSIKVAVNGGTPALTNQSNLPFRPARLLQRESSFFALCLIPSAIPLCWVFFRTGLHPRILNIPQKTWTVKLTPNQSISIN